MDMKLWVDDIRPAPEGWTRAKTISEAVDLMMRYGEEITHLSLDHDISILVKVDDVARPYPSPDTFKVVAHTATMCLPSSLIVTTHSSNPDGRKAIVSIFQRVGMRCEETPLERAVRN